MIQVIFWALLIVSAIAGYFVYYTPSQNSMNPVKFVEDHSGYTSEQSLNQKGIKQINTATNNSIMQIRKKLDDLAIEQDKLTNTIRDQQKTLKDVSKDTNDILREAKMKGATGDIPSLETLSKSLQDEQLSMETGSKGLLSLNDQLTKSRQAMAGQIDFANNNAGSSLPALQKQYTLIKNQTSGLLNKVKQYDQGIHDDMNEIQSNAGNTSYSSFVQQQGLNERIKQMMDRENDDMRRIADSEERSRSLMEDVRQRMEDAKERLDDSLQKSKDFMEDERQKEEDQQEIIQQRIEDQKQRIQDQQR